MNVARSPHLQPKGWIVQRCPPSKDRRGVGRCSRARYRGNWQHQHHPAVAKENQCEWISVAGGDGTVESVAAVVVGTQIPLGIIPAGTFNNFARSLDLPLDPIEACKIVVAGNVRAVDVGFANGRPFFECLGSGLDAALYPITEEIKSGQLTRIMDFLRRAYWFRRQIFALTLDRPVCDALVHVANQ